LPNSKHRIANGSSIFAQVMGHSSVPYSLKVIHMQL